MNHNHHTLVRVFMALIAMICAMAAVIEVQINGEPVKAGIFIIAAIAGYWLAIRPERKQHHVTPKDQAPHGFGPPFNR